MAQATRLPKTVTIFTGVELTLSEEEAQTLLIVTARIGGDLKTSPRKHLLAISRALKAAGYKRQLNEPPVEGNIYF